MKRSFIGLMYLLCPFLSAAQTNDSLSSERVTLHFQATVINQYKPAFDAPYSGLNSLQKKKESQTSLTSTLYMGARLWKGASVYLNPEIAGGSGLSEALGVSEATNGETFRIGDPSPKIYLARLYAQQYFALNSEREQQETDANQLKGMMPTSYFSVTAGKVCIADFFDANNYSHDPRAQFMSWALMSNGAWDYPANTRGYTPGLVLELVHPTSEWRYTFSLLPKQANGNDMNWDVQKVGAQALEYTRNYHLKKQEGSFRLLAFYNMANMGNYKSAIHAGDSLPDITADRKNGRSKYGFTFNMEQKLNSFVGLFVRAGWNDGHNETWAFTEIDRTVSAGIVLDGQRWKRDNDNLGIAFVTSGLSNDHRDYLKAGGRGFMLGDGKLNYSWERLGEVYYSAEMVKNQIFLSGTYQLLMNPGYNMDRKGPVHVFSVRLHAEI